MFNIVRVALLVGLFSLLVGCSNSHLEIFPDLPDYQLMDKKIEPELLKQDIQAYYQGAIERHPDIAKYANMDELKKTVQQLQGQITKPMTRLAFYKIVGQLTHRFNDGHSMLIWPYQEYERLKSAGGVPFPFLVKVTQDGEILLRHSYQYEQSTLAAGSKIKAINQQSSTDLLDSMQKYVGGESEYLRQQFVADRFGLILWAVFGITDQFELEVEHDGKVKSIAFDKAQQWVKSEQKNMMAEEFYLKQLESGVGYLYIGHFDIDPDWFEGFIDQTFAKIRQSRMTSLIIDIRDNTGGNTDTVAYLARYLAKKDFRLVSKMSEKLNNDNRGLMNYKGQVGELIEHDWDDWEEPIDSENRYTGQSYLLISPITYSAGIVFATTLKDNDMAILIGQETGGNANQTAQGNLFNLPNSQLRAYITTRLLVRPNGSKEPGGVKPHYEVIPTAATIAAESDLAMDKALELIHLK